MKRYARTTVWLAGCIALLYASGARAGTYDVLACGGLNSTWSKSTNHGGMAAYPDPPGCGDGLVSRHNGQPRGWTVPTGAASRWFFYAPTGAAIVGVAMRAQFQTLDHRWQSVLSNGNAVLAGCPAGHDGCTAGLNGSYMNIPWSGVIYTEVFCPVGPCPAYWQSDANYGNVFARSIIFGASVRIYDASAPDIGSVSGPAWTDQWIGGTQPVSFDASDNTGVTSVVTAIDETRSSARSRSCDLYQLTCPNWPAATLDVDTRLVADGSHRLRLGAVDRAGNYGEATRTINVDNNPPLPPTNVTLGDGRDWRSSSHVQIAWRDPKQEFAPIAGAVIQACPAGGGRCVRRDVAGRDLTAGDVDLPSPGRWDVRVWLKDAVGNQTSANASDPIQLGYDPDPPEGVGFLPLDPENPARLFVQAHDRLAGLGGGEIEIRRDGTESWRSLPTSLDGGGVSSSLPDDQLPDGHYFLRARVWDTAGNERTTSTRVDGSAAEVTLPVRIKTRLLVGAPTRVRARDSRGHRRLRTIYVRNPLVDHGRRARIGGRLVAPGGNPLVGVSVDVSARLDLPGSTFTPVATLTTSKTGHFSYLLPAGPSRIVQFRYAGAAKIRPQTHIVRLRVRAGSTVSVRPRRVVTGEYATFRGRISTRPVPSTGKLVELQYYDRGHWRTFRSVRAAASTGRWRYSYRFTGTAGVRTYRFRAYVPRENGYPYAPGASTAVLVTVRGL